jgi:hypothetical protein
MECQMAGSEKALTAWVALRDDGIYDFNCPNGHANRAYLQEQKFEILFELGLYAILDGYYREAFSAFAAALERFYEFFVTVIAQKHGVEESTILNAWKPVSDRSERQLGAFVVAYLIGRKTVPKLLHDKSVALRNSVIHKGRFASEAEAIAFGTEVLSLIDGDLHYLQTQERVHVDATVKQYVARVQPAAGQTYISFPTAIRLARSITESRPLFDEAMRDARKWRARWEGPSLM